MNSILLYWFSTRCLVQNHLESFKKHTCLIPTTESESLGFDMVYVCFEKRSPYDFNTQFVPTMWKILLFHKHWLEN